MTKMLSGLTEVLTITRAQAKKKPQENTQEKMSLKNSWEEQRQVRGPSTRNHRKATKEKRKNIAYLYRS